MEHIYYNLFVLCVFLLSLFYMAFICIGSIFGYFQLDFLELIFCLVNLVVSYIFLNEYGSIGP
ncbi:putative membrane protein (plasmid) [Yersinia frederiksenii Y225]|nr:putative membrane protein [Yersinia frederiksenii Y225]